MPPDWDPAPYRDHDGKPGCMLCVDLGYNKHRGFFAWCGCQAAKDRRLEEPQLIEEANRQDEELRKRFA